jgi:hypothetical protein
MADTAVAVTLAAGTRVAAIPAGTPPVGIPEVVMQAVVLTQPPHYVQVVPSPPAELPPRARGPATAAQSLELRYRER